MQFAIGVEQRRLVESQHQVPARTPFDLELTLMGAEPGPHEQLQPAQRTGVAHGNHLEQAISDRGARGDTESAAETRAVRNDDGEPVRHRSWRAVTVLN